MIKVTIAVQVSAVVEIEVNDQYELDNDLYINNLVKMALKKPATVLNIEDMARVIGSTPDQEGY